MPLYVSRNLICIESLIDRFVPPYLRRLNDFRGALYLGSRDYEVLFGFSWKILFKDISWVNTAYFRRTWRALIRTVPVWYRLFVSASSKFLAKKMNPHAIASMLCILKLYGRYLSFLIDMGRGWSICLKGGSESYMKKFRPTIRDEVALKYCYGIAVAMPGTGFCWTAQPPVLFLGNSIERMNEEIEHSNNYFEWTNDKKSFTLIETT